MLKMEVDSTALRPLIQEVVRETLLQMDTDRAHLDGKLAFSEEEAATLMGLAPHVLRDERRRGKIQSSRIVGGRIRYCRADLMGYLADRRTPNSAEAR
jgi:hypothetical protein